MTVIIGFIVLLHLIAFLLIADGIVIIIKKSRKNKKWSSVREKIYCKGVIAVALTIAVIGYGRYNMFHVIRTEYTLQTQKDIQTEGYRLVLLSDLHYGVSMSDEQLQKIASARRAPRHFVVIDMRKNILDHASRPPFQNASISARLACTDPCTNSGLPPPRPRSASFMRLENARRSPPA